MDGGGEKKSRAITNRWIGTPCRSGPKTALVSPSNSPEMGKEVKGAKLDFFRREINGRRCACESCQAEQFLDECVDTGIT